MKHLKDFRVLAVLAIASVGLAFEGLRHFQFSSLPVDEMGKAGEIYSIHQDSTIPARQEQVRQIKSRPQKMEAMANPRGIMFDLKKAVGEYQKEHGLDQKKDKKAALDKKKKPQYEYVYDKRTGQWIKRKKLTPEQKRILAEKRKQLKKDQDLAKAKDEKDKSPEASVWTSTPDSYAAGVAPKQNEAKEKEEDFLSYEEWASRLLNYPDKAALSQFVEAYRSQKVTSDIYTRIMEAMMSDPRIEMKEQGLLLASYSPSANSFEALVVFLNDQSLPAPTRTMATKFLDAYSSIQNLSLLEKLMKQSSDANLILVATKKLEGAINRYLSFSSSEKEPSPLGNRSNYVSSFTKFIQVLTGLTQSEDAEVVAQARTTLQQLQDSLGRFQVAANQMDSNI